MLVAKTGNLIGSSEVGQNIPVAAADWDGDAVEVDHFGGVGIDFVDGDDVGTVYAFEEISRE